MEWTQEYIQSMIENEVEESLTLDYKAAASLSKDQNKKVEITKDVSAFANSAGGKILYGVGEYSDPKKNTARRKLTLLMHQSSQESGWSRS